MIGLNVISSRYGRPFCQYLGLRFAMRCESGVQSTSENGPVPSGVVVPWFAEASIFGEQM